MNKKKKVYITTAIPYVNGQPHIGFALEIIQADLLARYYRQKSGEENVFFLTGTDENALKNVRAAEEKGISTEDLVSKHSQEFAQLKEQLTLSNDDFIRTTEKRHKKNVRKFWKACQKDIYKKHYQGQYCVGCEAFKLEKDLENGRCPEHPNDQLEEVKEENYFFKLSKYEDRLKKLISSGKLKIIPQKRKNEVLAFIEQGLEDFSISRSKERAKGWGIPVPDDPSQVIYVWFDALINYLSGLNFAEQGKLCQRFWSTDTKIIHCIGKGITRFHAIYWPAMLFSAGLNLPKEELVHGYITVDSQKMSKSIGNVVSPKELVEKYGSAGVRYYLLKEIPTTKDGDFTYSHFEEVYNADLANGLGNLVQRVAKLCELAKLSLPDNQIVEEAELAEKVAKQIESYHFNKGLIALWKEIQQLDKQIDQQKPWEKKGKELEELLQPMVKKILEISINLKPFLPQTAEKVSSIFANKPIQAPEEPLFPRV